MSTFSGTERGLLSDAVLAAFPQNRGLRQWLDRKLNTEKTKDDDNVIQCVNLEKAPSEVAFDLVQWLGSKGRMVEFLVKIALDYPNRAVRSALQELLACSENQTEARLRFQEFLAILADQPLNDVLIRFIQKIPGCPDPLPEPLRFTGDRERVVITDRSPTTELPPEHRRDYREKLRKALSAELELFPTGIDELFSAFQIGDDRKEPKKSFDLIVDRLLDDEYSIPRLNNLIHKLERKGPRVAVEILETCIDLILPFHFAPAEVAVAATYLNHKGGGIIKGIVTTSCGAELVMAAVDQFTSQFDHEDPELRGRAGIPGSYPPLGKIGVDEAAEQFLTAILGSESREWREKSLRFHKIEMERTRYCVVRLPKEGPERDYAERLLERATELLPDLPILVLTTDASTKNQERVYLEVLRRRFDGRRRRGNQGR
jgi:hypothetical protein